ATDKEDIASLLGETHKEGITLQEVLNNRVAKIGEKLDFRRFARKMDYTYSGGYYRKGYRSNKLVDYFRGIIRFISNYVDLIYYD
ncbi:hypothetical protein ACTPD5_22470, partial [Clostridioides difficile]